MGFSKPPKPHFAREPPGSTRTDPNACEEVKIRRRIRKQFVVKIEKRRRKIYVALLFITRAIKVHWDLFCENTVMTES